MKNEQHENFLKVIQQTTSTINSALASVSTIQELENFRIEYLARKGKIALLFDQLKTVPVELKRDIGKQLNTLRTSAEKKFDELSLRFAPKQEKTSPSIDLTLPGRSIPRGTRHPLTQTLEQIKSIFLSMGFSIADGPEIEDDYHNFAALNFPPDHPARDMQDTFFLTKDVLLRTHTSPVQIRVMKKQKPPVRVIMPGRVYRNEAVSARSNNLFYQVEGLYVAENVSFSELKGTLVVFAKRFYGENIRYRFRSSYFPFTEPSLEMDISCFLCSGTGCRMCKKTGWLEVLGAGMVHPNVLKNVGYDPEKVSGYAFGMGIDRVTLLRHGIPDIRLLYENDVRFLNQF